MRATNVRPNKKKGLTLPFFLHLLHNAFGNFEKLGFCHFVPKSGVCGGLLVKVEHVGKPVAVFVCLGPHVQPRKCLFGVGLENSRKGLVQFFVGCDFVEATTFVFGFAICVHLLAAFGANALVVFAFGDGRGNHFIND